MAIKSTSISCSCSRCSNSTGRHSRSCICHMSTVAYWYFPVTYTFLVVWHHVSVMSVTDAGGVSAGGG